MIYFVQMQESVALHAFRRLRSEEWKMTWGVNVMSHVHAARHVFPQMLERGEGYLMNTASAAGLLSQIGAAQDMLLLNQRR